MEKCPDTGRLHYQGHFRTNVQVRLSFLVKKFPGVHFEVARNWDALKNYDNKKESRVEGPFTWPQDTKVSEAYSSMDNALLLVAENRGKIVEEYMILATAPAEKGVLKTDARKPEDLYKEEYWYAVSKILIKTPKLAQCFAKPDVLRMWIHTRHVWVALADM